MWEYTKLLVCLVLLLLVLGFFTGSPHFLAASILISAFHILTLIIYMFKKVLGG